MGQKDPRRRKKEYFDPSVLGGLKTTAGPQDIAILIIDKAMYPNDFFENIILKAFFNRSAGYWSPLMF